MFKVQQNLEYPHMLRAILYYLIRQVLQCKTAGTDKFERVYMCSINELLKVQIMVGL